MALSTRSVSSDRTIRPSDSSSLSYSSSAGVFTDERSSTASSSSSLSSSLSPPSSLSSRCISKAPALAHQPKYKPQGAKKYLLYPPSVNNGSNNQRRHCQHHQHRHHQTEKRRSDKTIVDVIESYGCSTDVSPQQKKRPVGIVGAATDASTRPNTIKIVSVTADDAISSATNQLDPSLPSSHDVAIRDEPVDQTREPNNELPNFSATYQGKPEWKSRSLPKTDSSHQINSYPSIKFTEKNGIKVKRYPMRKESLESKSVSNPLLPLCSLPPQSLVQRHRMPYSPLGIYTSFTGTTNDNKTNEISSCSQQYPINVSPVSTYTSSRTTATRPATPLDPASPSAASAVCRASRSLQQHVSVWDDYDDDGEDDEDEKNGYHGEDGERRGLIRRVKGRVSRGLVFGRRDYGPRNGSVERKDSKKNERERKSHAESKRRSARKWGCGYI